MSRYSGWVIAGVVCLIIITLAVTGIINFNPATTTPTQSSSAFVKGVESFLKTSNLHNVAFKMVA